MRLRLGHRVVIALTGLAIGLRVLMPAHMPSRFGPQVDVAATLLQVVGILLVGGSVLFIIPVAWGATAPRKLSIAGLVSAWVLMAVAVAFGVSRTGLVLSLESTNWPLSTVGAVALILLSSVTWGVIKQKHLRTALRAGLMVALLVSLIGAGLSVARQARLRQYVAEQVPHGRPTGYAPSISAWKTLLQFREAYHEYDDLDDAALARRVIAAYPDCRGILEEVALNFPPGIRTLARRISGPAQLAPSSPLVTEAEALLSRMRQSGKKPSDLNHQEQALLRRYQTYLRSQGFLSYADYPAHLRSRGLLPDCLRTAPP